MVTYISGGSPEECGWIRVGKVFVVTWPRSWMYRDWPCHQAPGRIRL